MESQEEPVGYWKQKALEEAAEGLDLRGLEDKYVCADCFDDQGIGVFIAEHAVAQPCSFCDSEMPDASSAPLVDVIRYMNECIHREYDDAANHLGWESREGGYQGIHWDSWELIDQLQLELPRDDGALRQALIDAFSPTTWCSSAGYGLLESEIFQFSWETFCETIMHRQRFFFLKEEPMLDDPAEELLGPAAVLELIAEVCKPLVRVLPSGTPVYRVRNQRTDKPPLKATGEFGPPDERAPAPQANRMNPPGIPVLYTALDKYTALVETWDGLGTVVLGTLVLCRDASILDLTQLAPIPSLFLRDPSLDRPKLQFLHKFVRDISRPVERDGRDHYEYVPTQVVSEYFRTAFRPGGESLDGIKYPSSKPWGGENLVLFVGQGDMLLTAEELSAEQERGVRQSPQAWIKRQSVMWLSLERPTLEQALHGIDIDSTRGSVRLDAQLGHRLRVSSDGPPRLGRS